MTIVLGRYCLGSLGWSFGKAKTSELCTFGLEEAITEACKGNIISYGYQLMRGYIGWTSRKELRKEGLQCWFDKLSSFVVQRRQIDYFIISFNFKRSHNVSILCIQDINLEIKIITTINGENHKGSYFNWQEKIVQLFKIQILDDTSYIFLLQSLGKSNRKPNGISKPKAVKKENKQGSSSSKVQVIVDTKNLKVIKAKGLAIPKKLNIITEKNLASAILFPVSQEEFFKDIFTKRALVIKGFSSDRFEEITDKQMFGLNVKKMCKNTASDNIHIWFPPPVAVSGTKKKTTHLATEIKSYETDDYKMAETAFSRGNSSLYFGSSLKFRNLYCKRLASQLGMNFGSYFPGDFQTMGEIETFCSRKGNLTDFHTDFQENFTLQIRGSKKWRLKRSGLEQPILGYTPHYSKTGNLEQQSKVHIAYAGIDMGKDHKSLMRGEENVDEVILEEGDILYHPAGIWHSVECISDTSISINFSLRQLRLADLILNAQRMVLYKNDLTRHGIIFRTEAEFQSKLAAGLQLAKQALNLNFIMPACLILPRTLNFNLDASPEDYGKEFNFKFHKDTQLVLNPLFVLLKVSEMSQPPEDALEAQYIVNGLFGTEDNSSIVRILLSTGSKKTLEVCDYILSLYSSKGGLESVKITFKTLKQKFPTMGKKLEVVIRNLVFNGVLAEE